MRKNEKAENQAAVTAGLILAGLLLEVTEYLAKQEGLTLRTFAQMIKGSYLWLVMPMGILVTVNAQIKRLEVGTEIEKVFHAGRRIALAVLMLTVFAASFFRGIFYVFTDEMATERRTDDGYLEVTRADFLSESHTDYYEVVAGIFRRPFLGWSREVLVEKVREKYGRESEYVREQSDGQHVFRLPDQVAKGEYIYFQVSDSYTMKSNGFYQILRSEAEHFWENRNRYVMLGQKENMGMEDIPDFGERFHIACYDTEEDISACAADLTDWLQFVKDVGQYPYGKDAFADSLLAGIEIGRNSDFFSFNMRPLEDFMRDEEWRDRYEKMKEKLEEAFREHRYYEVEGVEAVQEQENGETDSQGEASAQEGWNFMDTYDGHYEKECEVGDGRIRYRMVVEDAALGSRFYGLLKSTDGGRSWQMSNPDPFDQQLGQGIDFIFLDEQFGFASLMHNGGDEADLYVTEDGGESYERVVMESYTVTLEDGYTYNPYDYPQMPYEKEGVIYVLCGQGADGDYAGGDHAGLALYCSEDRGHTFSFVEIWIPGTEE